MKYFSTFVGTVALVLIFGASNVRASEGTFTLRNRVGENARCFATSILMQDRNYNILVSCRDILYPGGTNVFNYVVWGAPVDGGDPFRLGTVDLGKVQFKTKTPFNNLFVTKENDARPRSPVGTVVMSGNLEIIDFLDNAGNSSVSITSPVSNQELGEPEITPTPTPAPRNIGRIIAAGGVLAFIAIFGVVLVIFVITRRK